MVVADTYAIEKPYMQPNVRVLDGAHAGKDGLDRIRKVVGLERAKADLMRSQEKMDVRKGG